MAADTKQRSTPGLKKTVTKQPRPPWLDDFVYAAVVKRFIGKLSGQMLDKEQFTDMFGYVVVMTSRGERSVSAASHFLHGGGGCKVRGLTFRPGQSQKSQIVTENGVDAFNVYRPLTMKATSGSPKPWLDLGKHVIPDEAVRDHHLKYFAHLIQHPEQKINHALLLIGVPQGVGKDSWFAPVIRLLGGLATYITPADLANDFNDYLFQKLLIVVEELAEFGNHTLPNKLKPILARPPDTLRINRKGVPQFDIPNVVHSFMMSNHDRPLNIEAGDRRFHVYQTPAEPKPKGFYASFYKWLDGDLGDVLGFLQRYDLADFNPYAPPPMTATKQILIAASEPLLDQHLKGLIDDLPSLVTLKQIRGDLSGRLKDTSPHRLAAALVKFGAREVGRIRLDKRQHVWALREHTEYEGLTEKQLKDRYLALQVPASLAPSAALKRA